MKVKLLENKNYIFLLLILICVPALLFLFKQGFPQTDDGNWMVVRFSAFYQTMRDGQFPPRFLGRLNHEYGYPVADFLYPGFLYLAIPIKILGAGFVNSIKILIGLTFIISSFFTFYWLRKHFSKEASLIGTICYIYFPYRLFDLYTRGSVGELLGFGVLPIIFWAIDTNKKVTLIVTFAILLLSHNTFAFIVSPVILIYVLINKRKTLVPYLLVSLLIDAFFIIPALFDLQYTQFKNTTIVKWQDYFLSLETLGLFGLTGILLFLGGLIAFFKKQSSLFVLFFITFIVGVFFSSSFSQAFWNIGLFPKIIQFPWRFMILCTLASSFLAAFCFEFFKSRQIIFGLVIVVIIIAAFPYIIPRITADYGDGFYLTNEDSTTVSNEYMPLWVKDIQTKKPDSLIEVSDKDTTAEVVRQNNKELLIQTHSLNQSQLTINKIYFPGWEISINNKPVNISYNNPKGLLQVIIPKGEATVMAKFSETNTRMFADVLSLVGIFITLVLSYKLINFKKLKIN